MYVGVRERILKAGSFSGIELCLPALAAERLYLLSHLNSLISFFFNGTIWAGRNRREISTRIAISVGSKTVRVCLWMRRRCHSVGCLGSQLSVQKQLSPILLLWLSCPEPPNLYWHQLLLPCHLRDKRHASCVTRTQEGHRQDWPHQNH